MSFTISGLPVEEFEPLFGLGDEPLAERGVIRQKVDQRPGYPCRVSLEDPEVGEDMLLMNYESHRTTSPYRSSYAIYVREGAAPSAIYEDELPPVLKGRPIALRLFDMDGMLIGADMDFQGALVSKIKAAFEKQGRRVYSRPQRHAWMFCGGN